MKHDELDLERRCREWARRHGWVAGKLEKNGLKGIPDDLFISPDERVVLVEFKRDGRQKLRPEQGAWEGRFPRLFFKCSDFAAFCAHLGLPPE